jgi:tRNA1Val (adenine37-N6)-methyltransferase
MILPCSVWAFTKIPEMANTWFRFKQFTVRQDRAAFGVGTDSVLLGAWADVSGAGYVLDIGTGTGLLALMMAQRSEASICAIEIDNSSFEQALENVSNSPWEKRIEVIHSSLQDFNPPQKFDLVISNPPWFRDSLHSPEKGKTISRHDALLSLEELATAIPGLLDQNGRFCLVLPLEESVLFERLGSEVGLKPVRILGVRPIPGHPVKRRLMEFSTTPRETDAFYSEVIIEKGGRHDYTEEYRELTKDFYLAF